MCKIPGCRTPAIAQGLCAKHYMRQRRTGDPTAKRKPGPKPKRPQTPSHEVLALQREIASLRRKVRALEGQAAAKPKRTAASARVSSRRVREAPASDLSDEVADPVNFDNLKFVFAKTMPEMPHYYVKRTPQNEKDYVTLFNAIRKFGRVEKWRGRPYRYWHPGDGFKYWAMTSAIGQSFIINRAKVS